MPKTARETFLDSPYRAEFEKITGAAAFERACDYALLTYLEELPSDILEPNADWAMHARTVGARKVLDILRTLHLKPEPLKTPPVKRLNPIT